MILRNKIPRTGVSANKLPLTIMLSEINDSLTKQMVMFDCACLAACLLAAYSL
jgi:hypothetical protein